MRCLGVLALLFPAASACAQFNTKSHDEKSRNADLLTDVKDDVLEVLPAYTYSQMNTEKAIDAEASKTSSPDMPAIATASTEVGRPHFRLDGSVEEMEGASVKCIGDRANTQLAGERSIHMDTEVASSFASSSSSPLASSSSSSVKDASLSFEESKAMEMADNDMLHAYYQAIGRMYPYASSSPPLSSILPLSSCELASYEATHAKWILSLISKVRRFILIYIYICMCMRMRMSAHLRLFMYI